MNLLFIGNSLSAYNGNVGNHVRQLAAAASPAMACETDGFFVSGQCLQTLWTKHLAHNKIKTGRFDRVVLQEDLPETSVAAFCTYAREFSALAESKGALPLLFMAWNYRRLSWISMDEIARAHSAVAQELGIQVAPVGLAWSKSIASRPLLDLYCPDREHPSIYGTYLAAVVIYAAIYNADPSGLGYRPSGISAEEALFLQRIGWETAREYPQAQPTGIEKTGN